MAWNQRATHKIAITIKEHSNTACYTILQVYIYAHEIDFIESALVIIFILSPWRICVCIYIPLANFLLHPSSLQLSIISLFCNISHGTSLSFVYVNIYYIPTTHSIIYLCNKQFVVLVSCKRFRQSKMMVKILEFCSVEISQLIDIEVV